MWKILSNLFSVPNVQKRLEEGWTFEKIEPMSTDEIFARLNRLGITVTPGDYRAAAQRHESAERLADEWYEKYPFRPEGRYDEDFVWMAAIVLWKRLVPDRISFEQIDDQMQEGYDLLEAYRIAEACDVWWQVWEWLKDKVTPERNMVAALDEAFRGMQSVYNWCSDFHFELENAGVGDPAYLRLRLRYCREFLEIFPTVDWEMRCSFLRAEAEALWKLGEVEAAETKFEALIKAYPDWAGGTSAGQICIGCFGTVQRTMTGGRLSYDGPWTVLAWRVESVCKSALTLCAQSEHRLRVRSGASDSVGGAKDERVNMKTYTFHVSLPGSGRVWRKIEMRADQTLEELHFAVQNAYGWDADHLYSFFLSGKAWDESTEYCLPEGYTPWGEPIDDDEEEEWPEPTPEEREKALRMLFGDTDMTLEEMQAVMDRFWEFVAEEETLSGPGNVQTTTLEELDLEPKKKFMYLFDYGDEWHFKVRVHAINPDAPEGGYPRIVESVGEAPEQYPRWDWE